MPAASTSMGRSGPPSQDNFPRFRETFLATLDHVIAAPLSYETELRELKGDQVLEEDQSETEGRRRRVFSGLLKRCLIQARK